MPFIRNSNIVNDCPLKMYSKFVLPNLTFVQPHTKMDWKFKMTCDRWPLFRAINVRVDNMYYEPTSPILVLLAILKFVWMLSLYYKPVC